jgi:hypothetical protein
MDFTMHLTDHRTLTVPRRFASVIRGNLWHKEKPGFIAAGGLIFGQAWHP